jgi:hypothetical protein
MKTTDKSSNVTSHAKKHIGYAAKDTTPNGHTRILAEEIAGAYALGQEIMGHEKHHVAHAVAEVLGSVAALKDTRHHVQRVD